MTELSDPISTNKAKSLRIFELEDTPELSSTLASHDDDEDGTAHALVSAEDEAENDELEPKIRFYTLSYIVFMVISNGKTTKMFLH